MFARVDALASSGCASRPTLAPIGVRARRSRRVPFDISTATGWRTSRLAVAFERCPTSFPDLGSARAPLRAARGADAERGAGHFARRQPPSSVASCRNRVA